MRPSNGVTFGNRYKLGNRIAIGGMGEVWEATDLVIGRTVAIKILKDEYLGDPGFLERFRAEARHAALVSHEGIANVFDYGEENGSAYLVMELVPGEALSTILERERTLPADTVLDIVAQTANALQAAHQAGLVHRDIKPGNLLITPDGRVKITDFGIARIADQVPLTATGQVMGTVQYLSPEQASGKPASPATDIYSLGIVAYECLAGKRPFTGESQVAIAMAQINEQPPELPITIAEPVRHLVMLCIDKKPANRPQSAAHLSRAATALRRGDLQAAIAAVPQLGEGEGDDASTQLMNAQTTRQPTDDSATTALTSRNPATGASVAGLASTGDEHDEEPRRKTWPIVVGIIAGIVVIGLIIALVMMMANNSKPEPTPSTSNPTPTQSTSTPTPTTVAVNADDYIGQKESVARQKLEALGFTVAVSQGDAAPTSDKAGTVSNVTPTGNLAKGSEVDLTVYRAAQKASAPTSAPNVPASVNDGENFTATWPAFSCPGSQEVTNYEVKVTGGSVQGQNPANNNSFQIKPDALPTVPSSSTATPGPTQAAGQVQVSYQVYCGGVATGYSPAATVTVEPR